MQKEPLKKSKRTLFIKILSLLFIAMTGMVGSAEANTCLVGPGETYTTIQSAINDLNCDTVLIQQGTYSENLGIHRNLELNGEPGVIIFGSGNQTVVSIVDPLGNPITVTISNVSIQNGGNQFFFGAVGGGIDIDHEATVMLNTVEVIDSKAHIGGGIRNKGHLTIKNNSLIKGNTGNFAGGGIYNECSGTLVVENSTISVNEAAALGGGIYYCGHTTLSNGTVVSLNKALGGGGLYHEYVSGVSSSLTIDNSTVSENEANGGGGIYSTTKLTIINSSTISLNRAMTIGGGGILHGAQMLTLKDSTIANNTAATDGAGLYLLNSPLSVIENSGIMNNTSQGNGGGIYQGGSGVLSIVYGSEISGNNAVLGGGIYSNEGTLDPSDLLKVISATISGNNASDGAGIYTMRPLSFISSTISSNQASVYGGGLFLGPTYSLILNSTFSANMAQVGGGLYLQGGSTEDAEMNLNNTTIYENSANYGGGIGYTNAVIFLNHTIVAHAGGTPGEDCLGGPGGTLTSEGYNLDSDNSCGLTATGDLPKAHPGLDPLGDYGGYTWTHRLGTHSEALNAGDTICGTSEDQRDKPRPVGNYCDIGSFEVQQ